MRNILSHCSPYSRGVGPRNSPHQRVDTEQAEQAALEHGSLETVATRAVLNVGRLYSLPVYGIQEVEQVTSPSRRRDMPRQTPKLLDRTSWDMPAAKALHVHKTLGISTHSHRHRLA